LIDWRVTSSILVLILHLTLFTQVGVVSVNLGEAGEMCRTLVRFFDEMNTNENLKQNCVNPSELLGQVCKKYVAVLLDTDKV